MDAELCSLHRRACVASGGVGWERNQVDTRVAPPASVRPPSQTSESPLKSAMLPALNRAIVRMNSSASSLRTVDARLAAGGEPVQQRTAQQPRRRDQRDRFGDVGAAAHAAVHEDRDPSWTAATTPATRTGTQAGDPLNALPQRVDSGSGSELAADANAFMAA